MQLSGVVDCYHFNTECKSDYHCFCKNELEARIGLLSLPLRVCCKGKETPETLIQSIFVICTHLHDKFNAEKVLQTERLIYFFIEELIISFTPL
ncbi:hypothetical protein DCAR_0104586 [Daucus carota subsp. sativus]|uniref:Uncharacterized protein n=1 Tax=Daucus carota subsp. sativus TaxID=79200 RepID=A0A166IY05_DAUCS|nr:hypothetical protein DCAR_0104586 [Daucus carota subsp. sativus]